MLMAPVREWSPRNARGQGPWMRELTRIISLGPSNYGPDVDNSSNYKAVGAWGLRRGRALSCVKAPSLGLSSVQGGGWAAPRAGQFHVVLISQARLHTLRPQSGSLGVAISQT